MTVRTPRPQAGSTGAGPAIAAYDFTGLTLAQQRLLTYQGWPCGEFVPRPRRSTVQPLIARGLVTVMPNARIHVPIAVHAAWCFHCVMHERKAA